MQCEFYLQDTFGEGFAVQSLEERGSIHDLLRK